MLGSAVTFSDRKRRRGIVNTQHQLNPSDRLEHFLPPLAVVVVTYNSADVLPGLLDSLGPGLEDMPSSRIVIVDNNSSDASVDIARLHPVLPEIIETGRNAGYAAGINIAAEQVGNGYDILVLNPDVRLPRGVCKRLQEELHQEDRGIVVPRIMNEDGTLAHSLRREPSLTTVWSNAVFGGRLSELLGTSDIIGNARRYRKSGDIEWATGAVLMISAAARHSIGPWDESFFLYSEEVDYMRRARAAGLKVHYVSELAVTHIGGEADSNPYLAALLTTNQIRDFGRRHGFLATTMFRLGVIAGAVLRLPLGEVQRASLKAACTAPRR